MPVARRKSDRKRAKGVLNSSFSLEDTGKSWLNKIKMQIRRHQQQAVASKIYRLVPVVFCLVMIWMGSKWRPKSATPVVRSKAGSVGIAATATTAAAITTTDTTGSSSSTQRSFLALPDFAPAHVKYKDCKVSWQPPPAKKEWTTKPLWLTAFYASGTGGPNGKGDILKPMINGITGLAAGAKNFHAQSKILKRCKGRDETATCGNSHPLVPIGCDNQAANFNRNALVTIRNVRTVFPTSHNDKNEAYHGGDGQVPENDWRKHRDDWITDYLDGWKLHITTWKEMKNYDIPMYVHYESMLDPNRGPAHAQRLAGVLKKSGFETAPAEDVPCIWYQSVKDERARIEEYYKYVPGYTETQQQDMLKHIDKWRNEVKDDKELVNILTEYYDDIQVNTRIDIPWVNDTKS